MIGMNEKSIDLGRHISMLYRHGRCFMDQKMEALEFGSGQHAFLFFLYGHNGASLEEISRALELDKATTTRAIQKLEEKGYVKREISEKDKRVNHIFLTQKAYDIQKDIRGFSQEWKTILTDGMDHDEMQCLEKMIERLSINASQYRGAVCKRSGSNEK